MKEYSNDVFCKQIVVDCHEHHVSSLMYHKCGCRFFPFKIINTYFVI